MKRSLCCPKCAGKKIWIIERYRIPSDSAAGQELPVVPHQTDPGPPRLWPRIAPRGHFDVYACDTCGYAEFYAGGLDTLVPDRAQGVRVVDATTPHRGPFR